ncbi:DNA-binding protein RFX2 isoform X1 [Nerophis lumbriciformis]|uniref:DNA-binding protein RFX2 isoform X1 n=1 Tax=Nerophis lumbriciformis TaxID=546530 RepID=UPI003BAA626A
MNPAETEPVRRILRQQEEQFSLPGACVNAMAERQDSRLNALETQLGSVLTALQAMTSPSADPAVQLRHLRPADNPLPNDIPPAACPPLSKPERFSGESGDVRSFLTQCEIFFELLPTSFYSERARVAFVMSHMSGRASSWATAEWGRQSPVCASYAAFAKAMKNIFQRERPGREAARSLLRLQQGQWSVTDFAIEFRRLAADSGWPTSALVDVFSLGLADQVRKQMIPLKTPDNLDELVALAVEIENRLVDWEKERLRTSTYNGSGHGARQTAFAPIPSVDTPPISYKEKTMQLGGNRLAPAERDRRLRLQLCLYCGKAEHRITHCPLRPARRRIQASPPRRIQASPPRRIQASPPRRIQASPPPATDPAPLLPSTGQTLSRLQLTGILTWDKDQRLDIRALIDSGSDDNFIDESVVKHFSIPVAKLPRPRVVRSLDGGHLASVTHQTQPLSLKLSGNHFESINFLIIPSRSAPVVLGLTWLAKHNPHIDWVKTTIINWGLFCHTHCLRSACPRTVPTRVVTQEVIDLSVVLTAYHNLKEVFSKDRALSLPPHRPYDCCINLLPGATLPSSRLYNISKHERDALEEYITTSLVSGLIRPSNSPLAAGFFFVEKKDKTLRPCIDYRALNNITVKNKYPLPLLDSAFNPLHAARHFTKLDLRNAYHLVRIKQGDEWKTAFNTSLGHFEYLVMPFGLTDAPAGFQALINDVMRDMLDRFVVVYLDDILVFSPTPELHIQHVRLVLQRLLENCLYVKAEKCVFHSKSVPFLGFIVERGQLRADPAKIQAVVDWPTPTSRKHLQRFLGFSNFYRRFIRNFSRVAEPLTRLTSTKLPFLWTSETQSAFDKLKSSFTAQSQTSKVGIIPSQIQFHHDLPPRLPEW